MSDFITINNPKIPYNLTDKHRQEITLDFYLYDLEQRVQRLEADLKRRENIENAPAKYED